MLSFKLGRYSFGFLVLTALASCINIRQEEKHKFLRIEPAPLSSLSARKEIAPSNAQQVEQPNPEVSQAEIEASQTAFENPQEASDVSARFFTSPSERREELAAHKIASHLYAGVEVEGQAIYEKEGSNTSRKLSLDSLAAALRWVPVHGLTGAFEGSFDPHESEFSLDEATFTLGATPAEPWYISIGQTDLPFGEYNSHFREDPATQILGEIQTMEVAGGYESDAVELTAALGKGEYGDRPYVWVGNFTCSPVENMDAGVFWASDLNESVEIDNLNQDYQDFRLANGGVTKEVSSTVPGAGGFISLGEDRYTLDFEYITALKSFKPGLIDPKSHRPWAWDFEATYRPAPSWEIGARIEGSDGLPDSPELQYGVETSHSLSEHVAISLEYLHGVRIHNVLRGNPHPNRDLILLGVLLRW